MDVLNLLDQFDSLKIKNTANLDGPRRFIRTQIFNGYTPVTALKNLYYYFTGTTLDTPPDTLQKCFTQVENNDFSQIPENFHLAFELIKEEYVKACWTRMARSCASKGQQNCSIILLSPRYALDAMTGRGSNTDEMYLIDMFHGRKKKLEFIDPQPVLPDKIHFNPLEANSRTTQFQLHPFNSDHFILSNKDAENNCIINLVRIDFQGLKCSIVDTFNAEENEFSYCIFDAKDPTKFMFSFYCYIRNDRWSRTSNGSGVRRGRFLDGKLNLEDLLHIDKTAYERQTQQENVYLCVENLKLDGDDVYLFGQTYSRGLQFIKMALRPDHIEFTRLFDIQIENKYKKQASTSNYEWNRWTFHDRAWYSLALGNTSDHQLIKFDLEAQKIVGLDYFISESQYQIWYSMMDGDAIIFGGLHKESKQHIYWRKALINPDKVQHIAMEAIRREIMFLNKKQYRTLVKKLPTILRPFGGKTSLMELEKDALAAAIKASKEKEVRYCMCGFTEEEHRIDPELIRLYEAEVEQANYDLPDDDEDI